MQTNSVTTEHDCADNWLEEDDNDQNFYYEMQSMLPGQAMRILWDGFKLAVDHAVHSNYYNDIEHAAWTYSNLIEAANNLPENQCDFWIERADGYLPLFWVVWMRWLEEWDKGKRHCLDD